MTLTLHPDILFGFIAAMVRATAWIAVAPPLSARSIPAPVKVVLAAGLAVAALPDARTAPPGSTAGLVIALLAQVGIGLCLGFLVMVLLAAISGAGALIGVTGGLNTPPSFDPLGFAADNFIGNAFGFIGNTLLVVGGGMVMLTRGFLQTFHQGGPAAGLATTSGSLATVMLNAVGHMFLAAAEIAAPLAAVMLLVQTVVALAGKASPQLNVLGLVLPAQSLLTIGMTGALVAVLPSVLDNLVGQAITGTADLSRIFG